jgi:Protein of unknown function (DUF1822)
LYELQNQILELGTVRLTKHIANSSSTLLVTRKIPTANLKFVDMFINRTTPLLPPCPGEIWAISGADLGGDERYLMIVHEPIDPKLSVCSGMLFSLATEYLSTVDVLIPIAISGLTQDVLAETWNVGQISIDHLVRPVGNRLSRQIYDLLLLIGDGTTAESWQQSARELGLLVTGSGADTDFHRGERRLLANLSPAVMSWTGNLVTQAIEIERELIDLLRPRVILSVWLEQVCEPLTSSLNGGWQDAANFTPRMAIATRGLVSIDPLDKMDVPEANEPEPSPIAVQRLKSIALGSDKFILLVSLTPQLDTFACAFGDRQIEILLQVYPELSQSFLPANLRLLLQDDQGTSLREVVARSIDRCIQLKFSGEVGETLRLCLRLGNEWLSEDFVI